MRKAIFVSILLTAGVFAVAQDGKGKSPVRLVFTSHFQESPFGRDPVWGGWPEGSMARAMTYIRSHRQAVGGYWFALIDCGAGLSAAYSLYPGDFSGRITDYCGYETAPFFTRAEMNFAIAEPGRFFEFECDPDVRIGLFPERDGGLLAIARTTDIDLAVAAFGREPEVCRVVNAAGDTVTVINLGTTGKYIGVADFISADEFTVKTVDVSAFPVDAEYTEHFQPLADSVRNYYNAPLAALSRTVCQSDALFGSSAYAGLFHRFQLEASGADVSLFACPVWGDSIPAGGVTPRDILRRFRFDNSLCVVELTGEEIRRHLEYTCGLRYYTMRRSTDDLLRMVRDRDGMLRPRTAVYNLDDAAGIRYEVDVSRPEGRRVRVLSMADGTPFDPARRYRVAMHSHRASGSGYLSRGTALNEEELALRTVWVAPEDYRVLLRDWLAGKKEMIPQNPDNWRILPEPFAETAKQRAGTLFD